MSIVNEIIETQEFATLPTVASRILELLENDNIDVRDLAKIIEADASITLKLLKVANSPLYATRTEINSIQQAIITLGFNRLTNIVLGVSIFSRFLSSSQKESSDMMEKFWWHSSCTGIIAKTLTGKVGANFKEVEFLGGLLHDIGKLALIQFDPKKYLAVIDTIQKKGIMDIEAEEKLFEVNHLQVGEAIAESWKLPKNIKTIIANHNSPSKLASHQDIVSVVRFSDILAEIWGASAFEGFRIVELTEEESWKVLLDFYPKLKDLDVEVFTFELEKDFKISSEFLNILTSN